MIPVTCSEHQHVERQSQLKSLSHTNVDNDTHTKSCFEDTEIFLKPVVQS